MINAMLLQAQLRRGLFSIRFAIVVVLSLFLVGFQWWTIRHAGYRLPYHQPTFLDETLLFSSYGSGTTLYQFLFPFLAALAGGSTLAVERRSGRLTFLQARSSYGVVERTSLCSGFLLGALGGVLPYVIDVLLAAGGNPHLSFIDGVESSDVDIASFQFILISTNGWVYPIYRFNQVLCIVVVGLLMAALSGLFVCLAVAISPFVRHRNVEVLVPVAFLLLWWMLPGIIQLSSISSHVEELNPILYLQLDGFETPGANIANLIGIAMTLVGFPAIVAVLCWLQRRFHDR
ncbi:ABC transporter permease [Bifidobacterium sp. DSM 109960]|uniref:ABC transporter permease n=1 Tax=Bifidobacterium erythrocebi TaxID=2675325 RepID=A0A7Y0ES18_9BIFI|nr:ABC transporter permease [Bifidobacterium sp. DSM 109960]